jgi:hypothetical protein
MKYVVYLNRSYYSDYSIIYMCAIKVSIESRLSIEDLYYVVIYA